MRAIFDPNRIIPADDVPADFVHGTRRIDLLEGDIVQMWLCMDQPTAVDGLAPMSVPVRRILVPMRSYVWNIMANMEWAFDRGILRGPGVGPVELRPQRRLLM